ncbi:hypothetical protein D8S78_16020 [Natrialba swarupiae]|nr:hypothetical protein [Natrialba swarupiae]
MARRDAAFLAAIMVLSVIAMSTAFVARRWQMLKILTSL